MTSGDILTGPYLLMFSLHMLKGTWQHRATREVLASHTWFMSRPWQQNGAVGYKTKPAEQEEAESKINEKIFGDNYKKSNVRDTLALMGMFVLMAAWV